MESVLVNKLMNKKNKLRKKRGIEKLSYRNIIASGLTIALLFSSFGPMATVAQAEEASINVAINEIAWMGTTSNTNGEWMELRNNTPEDISLDGWQLKSKDGTPSIALKGVVKANSYFLLERTSDETVAGVKANQIYTGALANTFEELELYDANGNLVDSVSKWYAGNNTTKAAMERVNPLSSGEAANNWVTSDVSYEGGFGTPGALNSKTDLDAPPTEEIEPAEPAEPAEPTPEFPPYEKPVYEYEDPTVQHVNQVSEEEGAINVYFNKSAMTEYAYEGNEANYNINFEEVLLNRIEEATESIDMATYELNLPNLIEALQEKASEGVDVRVVADAKPAEGEADEEVRYETMRIGLEKLIRGKDMIIGTDDDVYIISDSPIFAVEDSYERYINGLPVTANDITQTTVKIGTKFETGRMIVDAERKKDGTYYSPANQQHNKFVITDDEWVFTGTWNFTVTGIYGTEQNMQNNVLEGNQNHVVELHSSDVADVYTTEFEEMYGGTNVTPDPTNAKFHGRKTDNTKKEVYVGDRLVEIYFSPGDGAVEKLTNTVKEKADYSALFTIFSWSDQTLVDELKYRWEGSYDDMVGTRTGFEVKGLFDRSFTNQYWSANIDMQGRTVTGTVNNPNTRWANPAPVYGANETRKLHAKTMIIDADTTSDPIVVVGSTNWSNNGENVNDENMLFIHDKLIANQFVQEFYARYKSAGAKPEQMHDELNLLERSKQAVEKAETTKEDADIEKARTLVSGLNEENRAPLTQKLDVLDAEKQHQLLLIKVEQQVTKAEATLVQAEVDNAMTLVTALTQEEQSQFLNRLNAAQETINYEAELAGAAAAVSKAEQTKSAEDVYAAKLLLEGLKEANQTMLDGRLNSIQVTSGVNNSIKVKQAEKEVSLAEKVGNATHVRKAKELVSELFNSAEKTSLQNRLNSLK